MCAIIGSYDPERLKTLITLNSDRGTGIWSLTTFYKINKLGILLDYSVTKAKDVSSCTKGISIGELNDLNLTNDKQQYYVIHLQTNTTNDRSNTQPLVNDNNQWLIHNGIQKETANDTEYDSLKLFNLLNDTVSFEYKLSEFNGSFAAMYLNEHGVLYMFRNSSCPLYVNDETMDISSVCCKLVRKSINTNMLYHVKILSNNSEFKELHYRTFNSKDNDYFFI